MTKEERIKEATEMRQLYAGAQKFFAENRFAESYSVAGTTMKRMNLSEIMKAFQYWDKTLSQLTGDGLRVFRRVIPTFD